MTQIDWPKISVLIIDDQPVIRAAARSQLRQLGVSDIWMAEDGAEGLAVMAREKPICVLCDIDMRPMNGFEVVQKVRAGKVKVGRELPIAMLTSHSDAESVGTALALDINAFILKPVSAQQLAVRLGRALTEPLSLHPAAYYETIDVHPEAAATPATPLPPGVVIHATAPDGRQVVRVALADVPPGAVLARNLEGPNGKLLLGAGQALSRATLDRLGDLVSVNDSLRFLYLYK